MTDTTAPPSEPSQPLGLGCNEQLGAGSEALDELERQALSLLTDDWGTSTNDLGYEAWKRYGTNFGGVTPQKRSASWLQVLLRLERRGLVRRLDDLKPVAWQRVPQAPNAELTGLGRNGGTSER